MVVLYCFLCFRTLNRNRRDPEVAEWVQVLKQRYAGMKIVVGRDKLDEIQVWPFVTHLVIHLMNPCMQGVRHKLQAFEMFLTKYPEFQRNVSPRTD